MPNQTSVQKTVVVLGMHRSGTSLVGGILSCLGVNMGKELLPADRFNPTGYFEDVELMQLNEKILKHCNGGWDNPPESRVIHASTSFVPEIQRVIKGRHGLWGWKDPRTALTAELYLPYLVNPHFIVCWRNPYEIAKSLNERDGFDYVRGLRLTNTYHQRIVDFLADHPDLPRLMLVHESVSADVVTAAKCLSGFLQVDNTDALMSRIKSLAMSNDKIRELRVRVQRERERTLSSELYQTDSELQKAKAELQNIYQSRSWKLVAIFRQIKRKVESVVRGAGSIGMPIYGPFGANQPSILSLRTHKLRRICFAYHKYSLGIVESVTQYLPTSGWRLPVQAGLAATELRLDGKPIPRECLDYGRGSDPVRAKIFWYWPDAGKCPFTIRPFAVDTNLPHHILSIHNKIFNREEYEFSRSYIPNHARYYENLPDEARIARTIGQGSSAVKFVVTGYTHYQMFDLILRQKFGRPLQSYQRILDWGSGCGRVARNFFLEREILGTKLPATFMGVDIDADNVLWCQRFLSANNFSTISLYPPTPFSAGSFDLIYAFSVMTHLSEDNQFRWLGELARLLAPGGVALLTIHGMAYLARLTGLGDTRSQWREIHRRGICYWRSADLDGYISDQTYYQNTVHTHSYIHHHWSKYFRVVGIVEQFGTYQDLVVLQKK